MGTEVLRPRDCLPPVTPAGTLFHRRNPNPNPKSSRKPSWSPRPDPKKQREGSPKPSKSTSSSHIVAGHVTILQRGQPLDAFRRADDTVFGIGRLGPEPDLIPRTVWKEDRTAGEIYAGAGFLVSAPAPSALPLPNFSTRRVVAVDQTATRDLRRLLRLD